MILQTRFITLLCLLEARKLTAVFLRCFSNSLYMRLSNVSKYRPTFIRIESEWILPMSEYCHRVNIAKEDAIQTRVYPCPDKYLSTLVDDTCCIPFCQTNGSHRIQIVRYIFTFFKYVIWRWNDIVELFLPSGESTVVFFKHLRGYISTIWYIIPLSKAYPSVKDGQLKILAISRYLILKKSLIKKYDLYIYIFIYFMEYKLWCVSVISY